MSNSDRFETTARDIAVLYELALSTGRTLDLKDNCRQFIKRLMGRKNIAFCSVLIRDDQLEEHGDTNRATVIAAYPERLSLAGYINDLQQYISPLKESSVAEIGPDDPAYHSLAVNFGLSSGIYVLYTLGQIGLMLFYFNCGDTVIKQQELHQLGGVIENFVISLQGCLAFRRLNVEIAQREYKEQKLRVSEEKHRRLFETMVQGVIYQDINGQIISANPAAERIIGLTLGEILGRSVFDPALKAIREDGSPLPVDEHPAQVALTSGKAVGSETLGILQPSSGKRIWLLVTAIPLFEPGSTEPFQLYITLTDVTEKHRIEQDYQVLFREMMNGFALHEIILDEREAPVDYRFLAVNPAFEKITGLSAKEVVGKTVFEVLPATENEWVIIYGRVAITGEPIYVENYSAALDKYFEVTAFSPAPGQFATIFADITERRRQYDEQQEARLQLELRVEERTAALKASNTEIERARDQYQSLVNNIPGITYRCKFDRDWTMLYMSSVADLLTGYPVADFINNSVRTYESIIHPEDTDYVTRSITEAVTDDRPWDIEYRICHRGGGIYFVHEKGRAITGEDGEVVFLDGFILDITARKEAEAALAEEKEFLTVTLHSIGDGVLLIDTAKKITLINREAEIITGWSSVEAIGAPLSQVVNLFISDNHTRLSDHPLELILEDQLSGKAKHKKMQARDLQLKIVYCNAAPIRDKEGKPNGYVIVLKDMTDIQKMEASLALAQKLESIGQLAAGIAHEINTPMQYISDNAHFLKEAFNHLAGACSQSEPAETGEQEEAGMPVDLEFYLKETPEAIAQALEGIDHVGRIVAAMKNFSHSSLTGKKPADLNNAIINTLTVSRNEWKYVADVNTELDPQLPLVECEIGSINQVVLNMVLNATHALKDATDTGLIEKGLIRVSTEAGPGTVRIKIADNGTGIDPLIIDKIFDPFFTTKEVGCGTGQGLMIAHDIIVNKHGGSIAVHSEPGKGTEFTVTLPLG